MKFAGICLITKDVRALAEFYKKALHAEGDVNDVHVELGAEGAGLAIFSEDGMEGMAPGIMSGAGRGAVAIEFEVADVDAEYERLKALGVIFVKPPQTHPWGARSFWFLDPDGNIVDFFGKIGGM